jgi:type IV pilus assembly protein PilW
MNNKRRVHARGFSLVELMVALVVGLIVVGAVLALVMAIMKSNRQTLQSTRLNQELRATLAVIGNDLRRARSVTDPLTTAKATGGNPYKGVSTATAGCIRYAYDGALNGPWHVIRRDTTSTPNRIVLVAGNSTVNCTTVGGTPFGSRQVEITALTFTPTTTSTTPPAATDESVVREFTVSITGRLVDQDAELSSLSRTMSQSVFVRSIGSGN